MTPDEFMAAVKKAELLTDHELLAMLMVLMGEIVKMAREGRFTT